MSEIVQSLASGKSYVQGQVRVKELDGVPVFHIQVEGRPGNRHYGYALDVTIPEDKYGMALGFALSGTAKESLAGTDQRYWIAQFRHRPSGTVNMQTKDIPPFAGNRPYGNAYVFTDEGFSNWLKSELS